MDTTEEDAVTVVAEPMVDDVTEEVDTPGADDAASGAAESRDAIRVVKGNPTDEDIAALVTVLSAAAASASSTVEDSRPPELWGTPASMHRTHAPFSPYSFAASQRY
ncbi:MAG: acyl-CoA carboxylase subunit epsilon [Rhodococcus sp. (in: high G+C Gram-positive bacteria)]